MKKITKALIPAAGLGTRFLPITQAIPKEMLPLVDRPILLYIIKEAIDAGIEDIVIVQGRNKNEIIDFFDCNYELEHKLELAGKHEDLSTLREIRSRANIISIRQQEAKGLGHAVLCGKPIIGDQAFAVLLGDELMLGEPNPTKDLCLSYQKLGASCVSVMEVAESEVEKYGIAAIEKEIQPDLWKIDRLVEKPKASEVNSRLALPGRYVFDAKIFHYIENTSPGRNGEIQLTDAMQGLASSEGLYAQLIRCQRHDTGNKLGYLQAVLEIALQREDLREDLKKFMKAKLEES